MGSLDIQIFNAINGLAGKAAWLDVIFVFITLNFFWLIWLLLVLLILLTYDKQKIGAKLTAIFKKTLAVKFDLNLLWQVILASGIGYLISQFIGYIVSRPRPFMVIANAHKLISDPATMKSFPSDHTLLSFVVAFIVFNHHKKWGVVFIILASLVAISRIYVGVHYLSDVIGGIALAWALSCLMYFLSKPSAFN